MDDTICAISTAMGVGGISIIRISGDHAIPLVDKIFVGKDLTKCASHTINYGHIVFEGQTIDEVLVSIMRAPRTYTAEDVVEINLHGGIATTNKVLEILLRIGCRLAEPGEFTKRAFLNGRIDLVKAEAVGEIINADNENARNLSINSLTGKLSDLIRNLKSRIVEIEAKIEVNVDYPEYEDIEDMTNEKVIDELASVRDDVFKMLDESKTGKMITDGIRVALIGRPNVGKSSILNALLEEEKAIVTNIAGTTRDIVEGEMLLSGVKLKFIDTAGIRKTDDVVESIGVTKSLAQIEEADLVILVLSNSEELSEDEKEILTRLEDKKHIVFVNKNDLTRRMNISSKDVVYGNTVSIDGLDSLKEKIVEMFSIGDLPNRDFTYISNARQESLMKKVYEAIERAVSDLDNSVPVDIVTLDLKDARIFLSELLGEVYDDELIDTLFSNFCLGK